RRSAPRHDRRGPTAHSDPVVHPVRAADRLQDRPDDPAAVPRHRPRRRDDSDLARHGHGAPAGRRATDQAPRVRDDRRLAPHRRVAAAWSDGVSTDNILDLWRSALTVAASVAAPFLIGGLVVGLTVAVVQTATQL